MIVALLAVILAMLVMSAQSSPTKHISSKMIEPSSTTSEEKPKKREVLEKSTVVPGSKTYTLEDVKQHNKASDVWLIIDNKVYDFTDYLEKHPGGEALLNNAGADSTEGFHGPQHGDNVKRMIFDYYIGDLAQ